MGTDVKALNHYRRAFLRTAWFATPPGFLITVNGLVDVRWVNLLVGACVLAWWFACWYLQRDGKWPVAVSFALCSVFWAALLAQTLRRVNFVLTNGTLEGPEGEGSPLAFLVDLAVEQLVFIPLTITFLYGWFVLFALFTSRRPTRDSELEE